MKTYSYAIIFFNNLSDEDKNQKMALTLGNAADGHIIDSNAFLGVLIYVKMLDFGVDL